MDVCLITAPYMAGDDRHPASAGPQRVLDGGAVELLAGIGVRATVERVDRGAPFRDTASSTAAVNKRLAGAVRAAMDRDQLPVVLTGSCVAAQGVLAAFEHDHCGAIWIDAHGDFNTPETAVSGFFPGMSLAVVTGHCYRNYWAQVGDNTPLAEDAIVMFGVRDLWPEAEGERLERSAIRVVPWHDGKPAGDVTGALDGLAERVREVYLHIDFDGFAPEVAPGIVDEPVPGGLSGEDAELIIRAAAERFRIRAATLATFTPKLDREDRTLRLALRLVELVGAWAKENRPRPAVAARVRGPRPVHARSRAGLEPESS